MNHSQVAHVWAQQTKESGKASRIFFDGPAIFSYGRHYCIARFTDATMQDGRRVVLFNARGYSMSTAKHRGHVRDALRGLDVRVIEVPGAEAWSHSTNLEHFQREYTAAIEKAGRARTRAEWYLNDAHAMQKDCRDYCEAFALDPANCEWAYEETSPELLADARKAAQENAAKNRQRNEERERAAAILRAGNRDNWRARRPAETSDICGPTMLRMSANGKEVETSRGARVPVADAKTLWHLVRRCVARGAELSTPPPVAVGQFQLDRIAADGTCIVGCHTLELSETRAFAISQGWPQ